MAVETEELVLKSNVANIAARDAAALDKLLAAADKVNDATLSGNLDKQAALNNVKAVTAELSKQAALEAKVASFDAARAKSNADLAASLKKLNNDATGKTAADAQKVADRARERGEKDAATALKKKTADEKSALKTKVAEEKKAAEETEAINGKFRDGAKAGALALAGIAIAGAIKVGKLTLQFAEIAIDETTFREQSTRALDRLTKGNGSKAYDIAIDAAVHLGIDKETAVAQTKALLQAGLSEKQIPLAIKAIADVSVDLGAEKGNALKEQLSKINRKGVFNQESVNGLAEAGVKAADVYEALKKKGETTAQVMARLKTNQVDAAAGVAAVLAAVEKTSGGAADATKTIPGLLNGIAIRFAGLFDKIDTGPLKEVLKTVLELFEGAKGDKLKTEVTTLGNAIFDLLRPLNTAEGKKALSDAFEKGAAAAHDLAIVVAALGRGLDTVGKNHGFEVLAATIDVLLGPLKTAADLIKVINGGDDGLGAKTPTAPAPVAATFDVADAANDNGAADVGGNMSKGVAAGITANADAVAASLSSVVNDAVAAAEAALGIASPSKRLAVTGKWTALGMAKGMNDTSGAVANASTGLANAAAGGASPGGAGASASGGAGAGAMPQINININIGASGGGPAADVKAALDAAEPEIRRAVRRIQRDMAEGGGSLSKRVA